MSTDPTTTPGIVASITAQTHNLLPILLTIGALAVGVNAALFALALGWKYFASMLGIDGGGDDGADWESDGTVVASYGDFMSAGEVDDWMSDAYDPFEEN
jgi:hypothetical protein